MLKTFNFRTEDYLAPNDPRITVGEYTDLRNGIVCVNPTCDIECYINYLQYLNTKIQDWRSYGYLDLGMMPFVMGPSFLQLALRNYLTVKASDLNITLYQMQPVSQLYSACKLPHSDIWVFREDAARIIGMSPDKIKAEDFVKWVSEL